MLTVRRHIPVQPEECYVVIVDAHSVVLVVLGVHDHFLHVYVRVPSAIFPFVAVGVLTQVMLSDTYLPVK